MKLVSTTLAVGSMLLTVATASPILPTTTSKMDGQAIHEVRGIQRHKLGELHATHIHHLEAPQELKLHGDHHAIERGSPYSNTETIRVSPDSPERHIHPHSVQIVQRQVRPIETPSVTIRTVQETFYVEVTEGVKRPKSSRHGSSGRCYTAKLPEIMTV